MSSPSHQLHVRPWSVTGRTVVGALLAAFGVVVAHGLGYLSSYPRASARREALGGHEVLEAVGPLLVVGGIASAMLLVALAVRRVGNLRQVRPTWPRLAGWQMAGFLVLEFSERSGSLGDLFTEPAILVGALIQVPVAWLLVRAINAGVAVVSLATLSGAGASAHWLAPALTVTPRSPSLVSCRVRCTATSPRGPPFRLV